MPAGAEDDARDFYSGVLGLQEVVKPADLQSRGGCWFRSSGVEVHLGVDPAFHPATKAHPAFIVDSLDQLGERLGDAGYPIDVDVQLGGFKRFHSADPFGNRLEFLERSAG